MSNKIIIQEDGQIKELKGDEFNSFIAIQNDINTELAEQKMQAEAKAKAKAALLEKLGITEDEAQLLLG